MIASQSCSFSEQETKLKLQGDWETTNLEACLRVQGGKILWDYLGLFRIPSDFHICDQLIIEDSCRIYRKGKPTTIREGFKHKIQHLTENELHLIHGSNETQVAVLKKLQPVYFDGFEKIEIKASSCLGDCPAFHLSLASDGTFAFLGQAKTSFIGKFRGQAKQENLQFFKEKIAQVNWPKLKPEYTQDISDIESYTVLMSNSDGEMFELFVRGDAPSGFTFLMFEAYQLILNSKEMVKFD